MVYTVEVIGLERITHCLITTTSITTCHRAVRTFVFCSKVDECTFGCGNLNCVSSCIDTISINTSFCSGHPVTRLADNFDFCCYFNWNVHESVVRCVMTKFVNCFTTKVDTYAHILDRTLIVSCARNQVVSTASTNTGDIAW
jgi:hypothetical protein